MGLPDRAPGGRAGLLYVCSPFDVTDRVGVESGGRTWAVSCFVSGSRMGTPACAPYGSALHLRAARSGPGACTEMCTVVLLV